ncbi:hypothetical protein [Breoghania sp.]|uniref:hypothetical protein n=1 Tax=Breoghania sp. TaxID=2065378 RepID=UPI0026324672|nr:hypothetical protein [Breoghania sp.]MDJ0931135.1 hypothetical protein [Breoghania sp.]
MFKTGNKVWKGVSLAIALSLSTAVTVPPAFAGDSDNSPEMSGRYNWQQRGDRVYRHKPKSSSRSYSRKRCPSHRRPRHRNNDAGAAILGGILGLGAGLAIGSATSPRYYDGGRYPAWNPQWYRYCERHYRSFNP